jgi:hypothetical protein
VFTKRPPLGCILNKLPTVCSPTAYFSKTHFSVRHIFPCIPRCPEWPLPFRVSVYNLHFLSPSFMYVTFLIFLFDFITIICLIFGKDAILSGRSLLTFLRNVLPPPSESKDKPSKQNGGLLLDCKDGGCTFHETTEPWVESHYDVRPCAHVCWDAHRPLIYSLLLLARRLRGFLFDAARFFRTSVKLYQTTRRQNLKSNKYWGILQIMTPLIM